MGGTATALQMLTSDDLFKMLSLAGGWKLFPLQWELADECSLLIMRVLGAGDEIKPVAVRPKARPFPVPELLDGDPFADGAAAAAAAAPLAAQDHLGAVADAQDAWLDSSGSGSEAEAVVAAAEDGDRSEPPGSEGEMDAEPVAPEVGDGDVDEEELLAELVANLAKEPEPAAGPTPAAAAAACAVSKLGYVTCSLEPFKSKNVIGRITTWPENKPLNNRSVACRCYLHPKCSGALPRRVVEDEALLLWLCSAKWEDAADEQRKADLREQHTTLWKDMFKK